MCTSCRKSAQRSRQHHQSQQTLVERNDATNHGECQEPNKKILKEKSAKLDGPSIFKKYNSAVFMVFTSDGMNGYQGSGFFINDKGLAVSNYHVFQGTNKGAEVIKLSGSDIACKVVEVIANDSKNDFILFRVNCSKTNYIPIARNKPQVGEKVYAIGRADALK